MKVSKYNVEIKNKNNVILYNTLRNSYAIFDADSYIDFKENPEIFAEDDNLRENFLNGGFIIENEEKEWLEIKEKFYSMAFNSSMYTAILIPTDNCNLACPYCFAPRTTNMMKPETIKMVKSFLGKVVSDRGMYLKAFNIKWFGGEPLLCADTIKNISEYIIKQCIDKDVYYSSSIYTNLTLLNDENIEILRNARINTVFTTIDGLGEENENRRPTKSGKSYFYKLIENIKVAKEFSNVHILVNIDKRNQNSVIDLVDFLIKEKVVDGRQVQMGFNLINDNEHIKNKEILMSYSEKSTVELFDKIIRRMGERAVLELPDSQLNCFAMARNTVVITSEGELKKCTLGKAYGTLGEPNVVNESELYYNFLHNPLERVECKTCSVFPICFGGCKNEETEICIIKHLIESKIRRYFERKRNEDCNY